MDGCRRVQSLECLGNVTPEAGTLFSEKALEQGGEDAAKTLRCAFVLLEDPDSID